MALLSQRAGVKLVHVPYRGGGPAMNDALGRPCRSPGRQHRAVDAAGRGRHIASDRADRQRAQSIPRAGAYRRRERLPGFDAYAWWGMFAPAGTPKNIIERFGNEMAATLREERITKQLIETQQVTLTLGGPEAERASSAIRCRPGAKS